MADPGRITGGADRPKHMPALVSHFFGGASVAELATLYWLTTAEVEERIRVWMRGRK